MAAEIPPVPDELGRAILELASAFSSLTLRYALIGGIAAAYRGRPRYTEDVDFLLEIPQIQLPGLLEILREHGFVFETEKVIREWTQQHFTVLSYHGIRVDWLKPVIPLYKHVLERAFQEDWLGQNVRIGSAEGLILTKLLSFRLQDQVDIESLLAANRGRLDLHLIRHEWAAVADDKDSRTQRFEEMVARLYSPETPKGASDA